MAFLDDLFEMFDSIGDFKYIIYAIIAVIIISIVLSLVNLGQALG